MKKGAVILVVVLAALFAGNLSATQIQCPTTATFDALAAFNSEANGCFSQDKLFWGFVYTPTGSAGAASTVQAGIIFQTAGNLDIHGWNFSSSSWVQGVGGPAGFTIGYTIEVCPPTSACAGNVVPGTIITGADAVYAPVSTFAPGNEVVSWSNGFNGTLTSGSPGPIPSTGNIGLGAGTTGPISVSADFSGTGAITQTTLRFYESVPGTVPEPTTGAFILIGCAFIGLGLRRKKSA
jgi:hypothetical protein